MMDMINKITLIVMLPFCLVGLVIGIVLIAVGAVGFVIGGAGLVLIMVSLYQMGLLEEVMEKARMEINKNE